MSIQPEPTNNAGIGPNDPPQTGIDQTTNPAVGDIDELPEAEPQITGVVNDRLDEPEN